MNKEITISSPDHIPDAAKAILQATGKQKKIVFKGEMGAGKTTLIQAICRNLGITQPVTSPTFALINEYFTESGESVYHFDLYRIEDITELYDIGYEDYFFSDAWCFVEWPEKAPSLIPEDFLILEVLVRPDGSRLIRKTDSPA